MYEKSCKFKNEGHFTCMINFFIPLDFLFLDFYMHGELQILTIFHNNDTFEGFIYEIIEAN